MTRRQRNSLVLCIRQLQGQRINIAAAWGQQPGRGSDAQKRFVYKHVDQT